MGQIALSLALLAGANLMVRSFLRLQEAPSGFVEEALLSLRFYIAGDAYDRPEARAELVRTLEERLQALPGIAKAAATSSIPADDGGHRCGSWSMAGPCPRGEEPSAILIVASPSLFETLGASLVEGRTFEAAEHASPLADVALVNQRLARRFFPEGALGRRIGLVGRARHALAPHRRDRARSAVRGVRRGHGPVPPQRVRALREHPLPDDGPLRTAPNTAPRAQADPVRRVFREVDPGLAVWDVRTMEEVRAYTTFEQRFFGKLMGAFAGQALLLACLGVYGVLAYGVSRRTHEIGVRLALGARPLDVVRLVVRQGAGLAAAGVALGLLLAVAMGRLIQGILFGVSFWEPWPLLATATVLVGVVLLASLLPARRAAAVDPLAALRAE